MAGLRELKKQRTRQAIQEAALRLIVRQGFGATTCQQIAEEAEVSTATFFRYFPTKEDVVLRDDYDPMIAAAVATRPAGEPPLVAIRRGLAAILATVDEDEMAVVRERTRLILSVPALRARMTEQSVSARDALGGVLATRVGATTESLEVRVLAAAAVGALSVAVEHWAESGGLLADHVDGAFAALT